MSLAVAKESSDDAGGSEDEDDVSGKVLCLPVAKKAFGPKHESIPRASPSSDKSSDASLLELESNQIAAYLPAAWVEVVS